MKFKAHVTLVDAPAVQQAATENVKAKQLILQALQILAKKDPSIVPEAEAFLKGANL